MQSGLPDISLLQLTAELLVVGIAAATAAGLVALAYRWYVRERVQTGLGVLFGLSVVAVYLGTTGALGAVISGQEGVLAAEDVLPNLAFFAVGAAGSSIGIRVGDAVGTDLFAATGGKKIDRDVSEIAQTVGRVTLVRLPEEIEDIVGYDPMPEATKETLADRRFLFPRRLTRADVRDRLVSRLKADYGVGHIDLELDDDGDVRYLAVGSRAAGIGPTLPPATNAVAIHADPAHAASAGDLVQVWERDPLNRVLTGELRGLAGDVVTVAIDAGDTPKLDSETEYKLVTLPVQDRPDREFASLLRAAEETMATVTVTADSELVGTTVGELGVTVVAITREGASAEAIPSRERVLSAGDIVYAIAKPESLRQLEGAATRQRPAEIPADEGDSESAARPQPETDERGSDDTTATAAPQSGAPVTEGVESEAETANDVAADEASPDTDEPNEDAVAPERGHEAGDDESVTVWNPDERLDDVDRPTEQSPTTEGDGDDGGREDRASAETADTDTDDEPDDTAPE